MKLVFKMIELESNINLHKATIHRLIQENIKGNQLHGIHS